LTGDNWQEGKLEETDPPLVHMPSRKSFLLLWIAGIVFFFFLITFSGMLWLWSYMSHPVRTPPAPSIIVDIPQGTGFAGIQQSLEKAGVIEEDIRFSFVAGILGISRQLKAGEYQFDAGQTPVDILHLLEIGKVVQWPVTIPEGTNIYQLADILHDTLEVKKEEVLALIHDQKFISSLGLSLSSLEGYLFPDTYLLTRGKSAESILAMMVGRFLDVYSKILAEAGKKDSAEKPPNRHEVVTLASIVEKETGVAEERGLVAAVFVNRLKKNMLLQADPTVIYGIQKFDMALTRKDLKTPTAYNTYMQKGLPAGPICNPGRDSLLAVLHPAETSYLYFVSKNDGTHQFSRTLKEHNKAVRMFQR
jgi:UPF0755 protein